MKATYDKPWVAVGALNNHVYARAVSSKEIIAHIYRMGWTGLVIEHHLRAGR